MQRRRPATFAVYAATQPDGSGLVMLHNTAGDFVTATRKLSKLRHRHPEMNLTLRVTARAERPPTKSQ